MKHQLSRADIMDMADYGRVRRECAGRNSGIKRKRRMDIGPGASFMFESYDTMWLQVHEILHIEKGGAVQIAGELAAYNPLIPASAELVATMMIEIDDPKRRAPVLAGLGGFEETVTIEVAGETIRGVAEEDMDRTNADGKASSVQFIHFPFTDAAIEAFRRDGARVVLAIARPAYTHMAVMPETVRAALAQDFD